MMQPGAIYVYRVDRVDGTNLIKRPGLAAHSETFWVGNLALVDPAGVKDAVAIEGCGSGPFSKLGGLPRAAATNVGQDDLAPDAVAPLRVSTKGHISQMLVTQSGDHDPKRRNMSSRS